MLLREANFYGRENRRAAFYGKTLVGDRSMGFTEINDYKGIARTYFGNLSMITASRDEHRWGFFWARRRSMGPIRVSKSVMVCW